MRRDWLLSAADDLEGTGQADKAASPHSATAGAYVESFGLTAQATAQNSLPLSRLWHQLLRSCVPHDQCSKSYAQKQYTGHDALPTRLWPCGARVDGLEPRTDVEPHGGSAGHLSGSDRAARCPTGKVPAVGLIQVGSVGWHTPEQVLKFVPKEKAQNKVAQEDEAGQAIVTQMRTAADLAKGDCDRAMSLGP